MIKFTVSHKSESGKLSKLLKTSFGLSKMFGEILVKYILGLAQ